MSWFFLVRVYVYHKNARVEKGYNYSILNSASSEVSRDSGQYTGVNSPCKDICLSRRLCLFKLQIRG